MNKWACTNLYFCQGFSPSLMFAAHSIGISLSYMFNVHTVHIRCIRRKNQQ
jgi:hypothetical protein